MMAGRLCLVICGVTLFLVGNADASLRQVQTRINQNLPTSSENQVTLTDGTTDYNCGTAPQSSNPTEEENVYVTDSTNLVCIPGGPHEGN